MEYSFKPTDDVWSLFSIQIGYLFGLQVLLSVVMLFVDYSDESGSNANSHNAAASSSTSTPSAPVTPGEDVQTLFNNAAANNPKRQPLLSVAGAQFAGERDEEVPTSVPTSIEFRNLSYSVRVPAQKRCGKPTQRQLLTNINGYARPGCMTALMGPSGAGTFMCCAGCGGLLFVRSNDVPVRALLPLFFC